MSGSKIRGPLICVVLVSGFAIYSGVSFIFGWQVGMSMGSSFWSFFKSMAILFPPAFVLIGLFEVWVDREMVERHLGVGSGIRAYLYAILLACTIMAPLIIALPIAVSLSKKGARNSIVLCFISASTICRIPMTVFEATYVGLPFSIVRLVVSLPLVVLTSHVVGKLLDRRHWPVVQDS